MNKKLSSFRFTEINQQNFIGWRFLIIEDLCLSVEVDVSVLNLCQPKVRKNLIITYCFIVSIINALVPDLVTKDTNN